MTFKNLILKIHLWLGLASGLLVFIISITGCIFVFQKEISDITYKKIFFVSPQKNAPLPLSELQKKAQAALGASQPLNYITTFKQPNKAWEFMAYKTNDTAITYFGGVEYFRSVFVNPYNGAVIGIRDYKYDFFNIVKYIHWSLLLNTPYGQPIVGWGTLIFVVLLITGLILWWPKKWNKATKKKSFAIRWKAKYKRINYDLHNVLGFYSLLLALILALTGMVYAFTWFEKTVYVVAAGTTVHPEPKEVKSIPSDKIITGNAMDIAFQQTIVSYPLADRIGVTTPYNKESTIYISAYNGKEIYYDRTDLQFDQYTGKLLDKIITTKKNRGERLIEMNYDIHVGAIGGLPGKIIAFIISLICASLPVTGFLVWLWKKKKSKKNNTSKKDNASSSFIKTY